MLTNDIVSFEQPDPDKYRKGNVPSGVPHVTNINILFESSSTGGYPGSRRKNKKNPTIREIIQ